MKQVKLGLIKSNYGGTVMEKQFIKLAKASITTIFIIITCCVNFYSLKAATINSISSGNWDEPTIWSGGVVPGVNDDVTIGHSIIIDDTDNFCNSLSVNKTNFSVVASGSISISGNLNVIRGASGLSQVNVQGGEVRVGGNITFLSTRADRCFINLDFNGARLYLSGAILDYDQGSIFASDVNVSFFIYEGSASQSILIDVNENIQYHHLVIEKTGSNTASLSADLLGGIHVLGDIIVREGRFSNNGFLVSGDGTGKLFSVEDGGTAIFATTTGLPTDFVHDFKLGSTIIYSSASSQTIEVPNAGGYHNLILEGAGTKTLEGNINVLGNLVQNAGTFDVDAVGNYTLNVGGNWLNTGATFLARNGSVNFIGSAQQSISCGGHNFYNISINNSTVGTSDVLLNDDLDIINTLTLTEGVIETGSNKVYLQNTTATNLIGGSNSAYIKGILRRNIAVNTSSYSFPVGTSAYQRIDIQNNNLTGVSFIDVQFTGVVNHDDIDMVATDGALSYISLSLNGMWIIEPNNAPAGGTYDVRAYITNMSGVTDNSFAVLKRPTGSTSGADWSNGGGTINADNGLGRLVSDGFALRMGLNSFSEFGIGSTNPGVSLPIQLVSFKAKLNDTGDKVDIKWATATEINNDFFTIEKSNDALHFEPIKMIKGAGNSNQMLFYQTQDIQPGDGIIYYRLKQTDFDGTFTYSKLDFVNISNEAIQNIQEWQVFPNPAQTTSGINIYNAELGENQISNITIFNIGNGQEVLKEKMSGKNYHLPFINKLSRGIYVVRIESENQLAVNRKIIVQ